MIVLSGNGIVRSFGVRLVLDGVSMVLHEGDRLGVVGVNGSGKSTLLRILAGLDEPDSGSVTLGKGKVLGYISQNPDDTMDPSGGTTVYREAMEGRMDLIRLEAELRDLEAAMSGPDCGERSLETLLERYGEVSHNFEHGGGHGLEAKVAQVLRGLGISETKWNQSLSSLSGGERTMAALAKLLVQEPEILLLDEPTNHLDRGSVEWLEGYFAKYKGTLMVVSHDRYFLDRVANRILELEGCGARDYIGNYSAYSEEKRIKQLEQSHDYNEQQKEITRLTVSMNRLYAWAHQVLSRGLKLKADNIKRRIDRLDTIPKPRQEKVMGVEFKPNRRSGEVVLKCEDLSVNLGGKDIFRGVDLEIRYGRHIALIGPNGSGKSTLVRTIIKEITPSAGRVTLGSSVTIGYYDQRHEGLNPDKTALQELLDTNGMSAQSARGILGRFGLSGDKVLQRVEDLSGGERSRLQLAKLMLQGANFLILDEPTNHLDPKSVEALEDALDAYDGTILFVSHDRYFVNALADCIVELGPSGIKPYQGNYDSYLEEKAKEETILTYEIPKPRKPEVISKAAIVGRNDRTPAVLLRKKLDDLEYAISAMEGRMAELEGFLALPEASDNPGFVELCSEYGECQECLRKMMEEWEGLSEELG